MGSKKGRQQESELQRQAQQSAAERDAAIGRAETVDPLEQRRRDYVTRVLDWQDGKGGPADVRNFPDQTAMALYTDAKRVTDAGRVGRGYGTLDDGSNPAYAASLGKELESERALEASGRLEDYVTNSLAGAKAEAGDLSGIMNARTMAIAGMRNSNANADQDRYVQYLSRPQQPSFLKQLALGGLSGLSYSKGGLTI